MKDIYFSGDEGNNSGRRNDSQYNRQYNNRNNNGSEKRYTYFEDIYSDSSNDIQSGRDIQSSSGRSQSQSHQRDIPMSRRPSSGRPPQQGNQRSYPTEYEDIDSGAPRRKAPPKRPVPGEDISSGAKKKSKKKKIGCGCGCLSVIAIFLVIVAVIGFGIFRVANDLLSEINYDSDFIRQNGYVNQKDLFDSDEVTNILLIGVDRRDADESSRSDTMMLLSIDRANKKIKLTSFMRDMWVDIPGEGYSKINSSCMWGGPKLVMDTIEYNFNVDIDDYMLVDFDMFTKIVDGLGGVQVEVTEKEAAYFGSGKKYAPPMKIESGNTLLNGEEALWYCRIRYLDDDFHRTERQRKVISAIINKAKETKPKELIEISKDVMPYVETSIPQNELIKLGLGALLSYIHYDIEQQQIPASETWEYGSKNGMDVILIDVEENKNILYDFIYAPDTETPSDSNDNQN